MLSYIIRRCLLMIPILFLVSVVSFFVMELPPGDFVDSRIKQLIDMKVDVTEAVIANIRHRYGLDVPAYKRYWMWITNFVQGDLGYSLAWQMPVRDLLLSRFALTAVLSIATLLFTWAVAFPIGIYSAVKQYSLADFFWTFVGFIGLAIPNFLIALVLMYISFTYFPDVDIGGLFSREFQRAAWSWPKFIDFLAHLWIPIIVIGTAGTAGLIRVVRANLIDELKKPYVVMARSKGLSEVRTVLKYPVRIALNPFFSTVGWILPSIIAGETIVAIVLGLPTAGPLLLEAVKSQDMQLAGAYIMLSATLVVIGTLVSDIILVIVDPRIRYN